MLQPSIAPFGQALNVLLVWPRFPRSFWGFEGILEMLDEDASMPPLGLITVAALCPSTWNLRLLDHAFDEVRDEDYQWANIVMVSAMYAQQADARAILARARELNTRTFIGGPWASSEPEVLTGLADHVLVGEAEEVFAGIAADLEQGTARSLYRADHKPDMARSPIPRFDLLRRDKYLSMSVQFSRGCPFQCEFCDIITIYGRKPRLKSSAQVIAELDTLRRLGWRNGVFIVDDNFIGNSKDALCLARELAAWGQRHNRPFPFYTEASIDLAERPELLAAMVAANFTSVFIGIESPSAEALKGTKKFQNLRKDNLEQIRSIQEGGLWVVAGFIVGFDSDDETIFERQFEFIERTAISWAMTGLLQAPPTTPLFDRMKHEGRLFESNPLYTNFSAPNFQTVLPLNILMRGYSRLLRQLYEPATFFGRSFRSLEAWHTAPTQKPSSMGILYNLKVLFRSLWTQGVKSNYRIEYWKYLWKIGRNFRNDPAKMGIAILTLLSAHHFITYARHVAADLEITNIPLFRDGGLNTPGIQAPDVAGSEIAQPNRAQSHAN